MSYKTLDLALVLPAALALTFASPAVAQTSADVVASAVALLPDDIKAGGVLRIGASYQTAPMTMLENDGQDKTGISYDLAIEAAKRLGLTPEFLVIPFPGQVAALEADRIDLVWETTSISPERIEAATFVPFAEISYGLLVQKGNPANISDFASLCGLKIAVPQGSIFPEYVDLANAGCTENGKPAVEMLTYKSVDAGRLAIRSGNADGFMSGHPNNAYEAQTLGDGDMFGAVELSEIESTPIGIQFKKGNVQLAKALPRR